jgi:hypothetical protein
VVGGDKSPTGKIGCVREMVWTSFFIRGCPRPEPHRAASNTAISYLGRKAHKIATLANKPSRPRRRKDRSEAHARKKARHG